jgi:hypothetical protein
MIGNRIVSPWARPIVVVTLLLLSLNASLPASTPPNFIFILTDDLGYGDLSCYGAGDIRTPHIDRLVKEGIRFTDYYAAADTCSPSRAALMTGGYPPRTDSVLLFCAAAALLRLSLPAWRRA